MDQVLNPTPGRPTRRFRSSNLFQAWLVLILAVAFGAALAAVEVNLSDIIATSSGIFSRVSLRLLAAMVSDKLTSTAARAAPKATANIRTSQAWHRLLLLKRRVGRPGVGFNT